MAKYSNHLSPHGLSTHLSNPHLIELAISLTLISMVNSIVNPTDDWITLGAKLDNPNVPRWTFEGGGELQVFEISESEDGSIISFIKPEASDSFADYYKNMDWINFPYNFAMVDIPPDWVKNTGLRTEDICGYTYSWSKFDPKGLVSTLSLSTVLMV